MVDNQHQKISGYRDLTADEIDRMNDLKRRGNELLELISQMRQDDDLDKRCAAEAYTQIQTGMMFAIRAIARPEGHC